jgi:hypothetical protein
MDPARPRRFPVFGRGQRETFLAVGCWTLSSIDLEEIANALADPARQRQPRRPNSALNRQGVPCVPGGHDNAGWLIVTVVGRRRTGKAWALRCFSCIPAFEDSVSRYQESARLISAGYISR